MHITELEHQLSQNRKEVNANEEENNYFRVRTRIANRSKDIDLLLEKGSTPCQVSEILGVNPDIVKARVAKLERDQTEKNEYLRALKVPETGGYLAIFR